MSMIGRCAAGLLALAMQPAMAQDQGPWSVGGSATVLSEYVWRGVSQSDEDPAAQFELYLEHETGLIVGLWATSIDFTSPDEEDDGIDYELDPYVGWAGEFGGGVSYEILFTRVLYPGSRPGFAYDYDELSLAFGFAEHYEVGIAYSNDIFNLGGHGTYVHAAGEWELGDSGIGLRAGAGHYDLDDAAGDSYSDFVVALGKSFGAATVELQYTDTSSYGEALSEALDDAALADGRLALSLSVEF
jgi:uncharacterized protein (TIGR02001 family)